MLYAVDFLGQKHRILSVWSDIQCPNLFTALDRSFFFSLRELDKAIDGHFDTIGMVEAITGRKDSQLEQLHNIVGNV